MASSGDDRVTWENYDRKNHRPRMDRSLRAKIFLPFNALEGLYETLEKKEPHGRRRIELSPDEAELLNEKLTALETGDLVTVTYYRIDQTENGPVGDYQTEHGMLTGIRRDLMTLRVRNTVIPIRDICAVEVEKT